MNKILYIVTLENGKIGLVDISLTGTILVKVYVDSKLQDVYGVLVNEIQ